MKHALVIVASIIFFAGIGIGIYFFFFQDKATLTVDPGNTFGTAGDTSNSEEPPSDEPLVVGAGEEVLPQLIRITERPVASGIIALSIAPTAVASGTPALRGDVEVRYVDRASGNVYAYRAYERTLTRLSNKTIPGIQEASWLPSGETAVVRFLSTDTTTNTEAVDTYVLPVGKEGGFLLEKNLSQVLGISKTGLFTLKTSSFGSTGTLATVEGEVTSTIFTSPLSSLLIFSTSKGYVAQTKASSNLDGYAFSILPSGTFSRILGPFRGLTILPNPDGSQVLYSYQLNGAPRLGLYVKATGESILLPLATLSDKCVWSSDSASVYCGVPTDAKGNLPDDWYQGARFFTDRIWKVDLKDRVATLLLDPTRESEVSLDIVSPALDSNSDILFFKNKKDGSLWACDI